MSKESMQDIRAREHLTALLVETLDHAQCEALLDWLDAAMASDLPMRCSHLVGFTEARALALAKAAREG